MADAGKTANRKGEVQTMHTVTAAALRRLLRINIPLTIVGVGLVLAFGGTLIGLLVDPRAITGAPAWLKPAKFAVSTAIYSLTLAWIFTYLHDWTRTRRIVGWTTAVILVVEVGLIYVQAWRGTTSHFNVGTPLDAVLFATMGLAIVVQTLAAILVAIALWRQRFDDAALGWALRLGLTISIIGASTGGLMTRPTAAQLAEARATHHMAVAGAHTVGAADGGAGLPGTGWSRTHGDLRVPHFLGLHAMQALPLLVLLAGRRRASDARRVRLVLAGAGSYLALFAVLLTQALSGESLAAPSPAFLAAFTVWGVATVTAAWLATAGPARASRQSAVVLG
jgi:hypothetical protein